MSSRLPTRRSIEPEILDFTVPEEMAARAYRQLALLHRWLGDTAAVVAAIRRDPGPVRRILEVGCAGGHVLHTVARRLNVEVIGVDLKPLASHAPVRIVRGDAVRDELPQADVAFCMHTAHHFDERALASMIRNVGRVCRRFIVLDLVRHPLPAALFRLFVAPFASPVVASDGMTSFRRAYTPGELRAVAADAIAGTAGRFRLTVNPFRIRQMLDIRFQ